MAGNLKTLEFNFVNIRFVVRLVLIDIAHKHFDTKRSLFLNKVCLSLPICLFTVVNCVCFDIKPKFHR